MKKLILIALLFATNANMSFSQSNDSNPQLEMKELNQALEKMMNDLNMDSLDIDKLFSDAFENFDMLMDSSNVNSIFGGDMNQMFGKSFFENIDSSTWNSIIEQGMLMFKQMDPEQMEDLMKSFDFSQMDQMIKDLDLESLEGILYGMDLQYQELDSLRIKKSEKSQDKKKLKRI